MLPVKVICLVSLLSVPTTQSLIKKLKNLPDAADIVTNYVNEKQSKPNVDETEYKLYAENTNIMNFSYKLMNERSPQEGASGAVVSYSGPDFSNPSEEKSFAVKIISFSSDSSKESTQIQNNLVKEIEMSEFLEKVDPNQLFFPKYYRFYMLTKFFNKMYQHVHSKAPGRKFFTPYYQFERMGIVMDSLDFSLVEIWKNTRKLDFHMPLLLRMRIFWNLLKGVEKISKDYTHCDIKLANIMFKEISEEQSVLNEGEGIFPLEFGPDKYYKIQIIDFGEVVKGRPSKRRCANGTPGFMPVELVEKAKTHDKVDIYSSAMTLLGFGVARPPACRLF